MDEPCSALDPISTGVIEKLIGELRRELAVVIVTHNLAQAHRVADKVAFMYLGDLVEYGTTAEVFDEPRASARATTCEARSDERASSPGAAPRRDRLGEGAVAVSLVPVPSEQDRASCPNCSATLAPTSATAWHAVSPSRRCGWPSSTCCSPNPSLRPAARVLPGS